MKTNLKPLIDEGYRYFAIDGSENANGVIVEKFKVPDDAKNFYETTQYVIYTADRLVEMLPDFFEIKEDSELDLTQILKDCPEGTPLYSPIFGEVKLKFVHEYNSPYPIEVIVSAIGPIKPENLPGIKYFTADGKYWGCYANDECLLFPSKDCRDWSQFVPPMPEHEPEQKPAHNFRPFDRVLVLDSDYGRWWAEFYSYYQGGDYPHVCVGGSSWQYCIPYEGNEHLNGTICEPKSGKV